MIWRDHRTGLETNVCPVLAFTPTVSSALRWFDATHELVNADGRFWWRRTALPGPGSLGEQDSRLLEALEVLRGVHNDLVKRPTKKAIPDQSHG